MDKLVLFNAEFAKQQETIDWLIKHKNAIMDDAKLTIEQKHEKELESYDVSLKESNEFSVSDSPLPNTLSITINDLVELTDLIQRDFNESINSNITTGDLEQDNILFFKKQGFLDERCKNYVQQLWNMMTNLIGEGYDPEFFRSYDIVYSMAMNKEGLESAMYLNRLNGIARRVIPSVQKYLETSIIEPSVTSKSNVPEAK